MNKKTKTIIALNILLMFFSLGGIFSKTASTQPFLSFKFIVCYGILIFIMFVYALGWQQIIKRLPLTVAYANRAVTVVWGIVWGVLFFDEKINAGKIIGAIIVIVGVMLYVTEKENPEVVKRAMDGSAKLPEEITENDASDGNVKVLNGMGEILRNSASDDTTLKEEVCDNE